MLCVKSRIELVTPDPKKQAAAGWAGLFVRRQSGE